MVIPCSSSFAPFEQIPSVAIHWAMYKCAFLCCIILPGFAFHLARALVSEEDTKIEEAERSVIHQWAEEAEKDQAKALLLREGTQQDSSGSSLDAHNSDGTVELRRGSESFAPEEEDVEETAKQVVAEEVGKKVEAKELEEGLAVNVTNNVIIETQEKNDKKAQGTSARTSVQVEEETAKLRAAALLEGDVERSRATTTSFDEEAKALPQFEEDDKTGRTQLWGKQEEGYALDDAARQAEAAAAEHEAAIQEALDEAQKAAIALTGSKSRIAADQEESLAEEKKPGSDSVRRRQGKEKLELELKVLPMVDSDDTIDRAGYSLLGSEYAQRLAFLKSQIRIAYAGDAEEDADVGRLRAEYREVRQLLLRNLEAQIETEYHWMEAVDGNLSAAPRNRSSAPSPSDRILEEIATAKLNVGDTREDMVSSEQEGEDHEGKNDNETSERVGRERQPRHATKLDELVAGIKESMRSAESVDREGAMDDEM